MKKINLIFFILFLLTITLQAAEIEVVDVRRNIPLSDEEPIYRDYILTADSTALKKNLVVQVKRSLKMRTAEAKDIGEIETTVGQLKIIHVDKKIAVAREYKLIPREEEVMLEQIGIMTGDYIDLTGSFEDSKPIKRKERDPAQVTTALPPEI
ncbi:MAG: hypothetical protein A2622_03020 [Bdellovibrionales bacterium RIFCSPHIGHO2_01_FULL_40_29]|nr:MAG: hypothetical protein A2622_03020 [Bdellovibrionales bacterium RIFCSPHIGHO2_01_FULL_40_29]OFZ34047.1 MAG: hypothetical protein A3D17_03440 [Bdellovibrionales bacterium RIFCSPHIGHO2_02_FULL_40_15]